MNLKPETFAVTVSQVNEYIKKIFSQDENLKYLMVKGEISNFKVGPNGHCYFSLKDKKSTIGAVMFNNASRKLAFVPKDGDEVICFASVSVYEARGSYQLYVEHMQSTGQGQMLVELEKLKRKLQAEGLFDESRKRPINKYPNRIGVISALNSAALKDILTNIKRRLPTVEIFVFPSLVQGEEAPKSLLKAFELSQTYPLDTLIIGRGGGASEDLNAFNDETLVRAISTSKMPVIAAVGHEIDFTLVDFVADARVSTPTGAAEKATIDKREIFQQLDDAEEQMENALRRQVANKLNNIKSIDEKMDYFIRNKISTTLNKIDAYNSNLDNLNPTKVLERGYSITRTSDGKVVKSVKELNPNDKTETIFKDGKVINKVEEVIENEWY